MPDPGNWDRVSIGAPDYLIRGFTKIMQLACFTITQTRRENRLLDIPAVWDPVITDSSNERFLDPYSKEISRIESLLGQ